MASNKEKQKLYALYISQGLPDREAMLKAGYSINTVNGTKSRTKNNALKKIDKRKIALNLANKALEANEQDKLINDLSKVLNEKDLLVLWSEWVLDNNINMGLRVKVSELLAKANGMFTTKIEIKNDNYSDMLNKARNRLQDINTINITPENIDNNNTDNIVN